MIKSSLKGRCGTSGEAASLAMKNGFESLSLEDVPAKTEKKIAAPRKSPRRNNKTQ